MTTRLPPTRPRLIGLDLDGTVLDGRGEMPDCMLTALLACRAAGIGLAFLTGRRPLTTKLGLLRWPHPAYVCTNSGCLLWEYPTWRRLRRELFPAELLPEAVDALAPYSLNLYHDAGDSESGYIYLEREATPELEMVRARYGAASRDIRVLSELDGEAITQIALPCADVLARELRVRMLNRFGDALLPLAVRWPLVPCTALELFHPLANKGAALVHFAAVLGTPREEVLACGDDVNDLAMLHWAGWGVAMPAVSLEVAEAADAQLDGPDAQSALAEYLQELATRSTAAQ